MPRNLHVTISVDNIMEIAKYHRSSSFLIITAKMMRVFYLVTFTIYLLTVDFAAIAQTLDHSKYSAGVSLAYNKLEDVRKIHKEIEPGISSKYLATYQDICKEQKTDFTDGFCKTFAKNGLIAILLIDGKPAEALDLWRKYKQKHVKSPCTDVYSVNVNNSLIAFSHLYLNDIAQDFAKPRSVICSILQSSPDQTRLTQGLSLADLKKSAAKASNYNEKITTTFYNDVLTPLAIEITRLRYKGHEEYHSMVDKYGEDFYNWPKEEYCRTRKTIFQNYINLVVLMENSIKYARDNNMGIVFQYPINELKVSYQDVLPEINKATDGSLCW